MNQNNISYFINETLDWLIDFIKDDSIDINLRYQAYSFLKGVADRESS